MESNLENSQESNQIEYICYGWEHIIIYYADKNNNLLSNVYYWILYY